MINFRKLAINETATEIKFISGETALQLVERVLSENGFDAQENTKAHFRVVINGHILDQEFWGTVEILETDEILIAPAISGGSFGQIFKQVAIIAVTIVASILLSPGAGATFGASLAAALEVAAITIGTTLALNALIPPPATGGSGISGLGESSSEQSQMYTITSQNNNAKKFGSVCKVYGTHRLYPIIAANPYTEIEADPDNGTLVQFYYAIFDFGFGPLVLSDFKIGDTPITDYSDVQYRLVDLNKPGTSDGVWDDVLFDDFLFYKGDVERDGTSVAIDKNQDPANSLEDYQVIRNASAKVNGNSQEISLDFVNPQGLIGYGTDGSSSVRYIDLEIMFSKVGEDIWRAFNDVAYVDDFHMAGGTSVFSDQYLTALTFNQSNYTKLKTVQFEQAAYEGYPFKFYTESYGLPAGTNSVVLATAAANVGDILYCNPGTQIGVITGKTAHILPSYSTYTFAPIAQTIPLFDMTLKEDYSAYDGNPMTIVSTRTINDVNAYANTFYRKLLTLGKARISAQTSQPYYSTFKFKPKEISQYKLRITRLSTTSASTYQTLDKLTLASLSTRFNRNPILTTKRHVFMELKIRATNQLNGSIQNLSAVASSVLDVYDDNTQTWSKQQTNNPAWVFCDLLTSEVNPKPLDKSRLHMPTILEWRDFCDEVPTAPTGSLFIEPRFTSNFVLDFDTTLQSILDQVANSCQASLNIIDGKYGVLLDKQRTTPIQIFTPRNSWGFSSTRNYSTPPHALQINYVDPNSDWQVVQRVVYADGYDSDTATQFEELSTFACTSAEQAWRFGRYMMAQAKLRQETITINVDFEHLVCTRGDFVQITQDVMKVGGRPARVKTLVGNTITIDDGIDTIPTEDYGYTFRSVNGIYTGTLDVVDAETFTLIGTLPAAGDLIVIGIVGQLVFDCIIKSIAPNSDLSATITLVEKADGVYTAESSDTIPPYSPQITLNVDTDLAAPPAVEDLIVTANTWRFVNSDYQYYIDLDWDLPTGAAYDLFEVYVDYGQGYNLTGYTKSSDFEYIVDPANLGIEHDFKVLAVSATGKKLNLIDAPVVSATPIKKVTPPSDVENLYINVTTENLQLDWPPIDDEDVKEYLIRFSPTVDATWEASIPFLRTNRDVTVAAGGARTGTYLIKAIDFNGNQSANAAIAYTSIPNLFNLNVITETNDFPGLNGSLVQVVNDSGFLVLQNKTSGGITTNEFYSEGYYYYDSLLDLGDIYTVRLQSLIEAEGYTIGDLMYTWTTLASVAQLSAARFSEWDVEAHVRGTNAFNTLAEWPTMAAIDPISVGLEDNWTPWRKVTVGDFTARIFEFRLKLISNKASVSPRVFNGIIKADMPDRQDIYNNLTSSASTPFTVTYTTMFKGPGTSPNIQITQDAMQKGDHYNITNKTLSSFDIVFYNDSNVQVSRQFDAAVRGFGAKSANSI